MGKRNGIRWKSIGLKEEERLTAGLVAHRWPAWSHDGRWIAIAVGDYEPAWVVVDRRGRVARSIVGVAGEGAAFAPDSALALTRRIGEGSEIWLATTLAAPPVRLLGGDGKLYRQPAFSPDGSKLAFACADEPGAPFRLFLLDLRSGDRQALPTERDRSHAWPAFSPEGGEIFLEAIGADGAQTVLALSLERGDLLPICIGAASSAHPAPVTDELIVISRRDASGSRLYLIDRQELREREITVDDPRVSTLAEPAIARVRDKVRLAFTAIVDDGSPIKRSDVCAARLRGVSLGADAAEHRWGSEAELSGGPIGAQAGDTPDDATP